MPWLIVAVVAMTPLLAVVTAQAAEPQKRVLILSEFRPDTPTNIERQNVLRDTLNTALNGSIDYHEEYVDAPAFSNRDHQPALRDFLRRKYIDTRFDVVLVVGRLALELVRTYGAELFPGAPVVSLAADKELIEQKTPGLSVTGVARRLDPKGTLDFILRLQPNTRQVVLVAGGTDAGYFEGLAKRDLVGYESRIALTYLINLPMEELLARLGTLPERTAILYLGVNGDAKGGRLLPSTALAKVVDAASVPVYGSIANHIDFGIVGGSLHDTNLLAREAAELAVRLLRGERITNIPVRESSSVVPMANWPALQRWNLSESRLPAGTIVLRRELSLWTRYWWQIIALLSVLAAQALTIAGLLMHRTRRRRSEQALKKSQERYGLASVAGSVGVWDWNLQTNELYADSSLKGALGYENHEIGNRVEDWGACVHPADREAVKSRTREHLTGVTPVYECEHRVIRKDGRVGWCLVRGSVSEWAGSRAVRMTGTCTDITARKQAEEELHRAKAELARLHRITTLSEVGAALAHEINQPLTVIMSNAMASLRILRRASPDIDEVREALRDVIQDGKRASDIVARTRQVFTRHEVETTQVDINALILESCMLAHVRLQSARILLRTSLARHLPTVAGDRVGLQQVLWNLMTNAIDAMSDTAPTSRTLTIRSSLEGGALQIAVQDTGPGIGEADADRMFEPFFTTKPDGMGMGLSISRTIIEAHGGRLWAAQNAPQGAAFCFSLPVMAAHESTCVPPSESTQALPAAPVLH